MDAAQWDPAPFFGSTYFAMCPPVMSGVYCVFYVVGAMASGSRLSETVSP